MRKLRVFISLFLWAATVSAQQVPNAGFEDWSGTPFKGCIQPASWNACNVGQFGFKFNFAHQEAGHTGKYCMMVQDQSVGAAGIVETSPGYFTLGTPWAYIENLFKIKGATAGTDGGINWTYRPDTMSVWIKRTGDHTADEDFYLLYYSWRNTSKGTEYKSKCGGCTKTIHFNEESDIRTFTNPNECHTETKATLVAEGMWRQRKTYSKWTNIKVPIYYRDDNAPAMMNIIFSASNYPNFRANTGLYAGNSLYVDDIEMIYSDKIDKISINGHTWKEFDPNSEAEQIYVLNEDETTLPKAIECYRGCGKIKNSRGEVASYKGRRLGMDEITIEHGKLNGASTVIKVKSSDGRRSRVYRIKFVTRK